MKEVTTNDGKKGGWLKGKPHYDKNGKSLGGIKAIVTDSGRQVELEGGEVIINKEASAKHWKELSRINQSAGGGVPISPPNGANDEDPEEYSKGGKIEFNANHIPNKWILKYAENIKKNHPEIWKLGGNIFGNEAFVNLQRVAKRGHWIDSEEWMYIKWRSYVARHKGDFRIEGVVAMLKWVDKVDKGWDYMKNLIQEKINKLSEPKSMRVGGDVNDKNANIKFMQWYVGWYKKISDKINITFSLPNILLPFKEKNVIILDLFEKIEQDIDAKPYLKEIVKKADEHGVTIYLEPMPRYKYFLKNIDKRRKISKDYLISYYKKFGFELTSNKNFMKRLPKNNTNEIGWKHKMKEGGALTYKAKYNKKYSYDEDESHDLSEIAKDTKISKKGLQQIYNKGVGAYKTNPESVRENVKSKEQWGMGRVYSAVMGGKAARVDSNELKMATGGGVEFIPEKKGTLIRGNEIIKYFEKVNGNYRLLFYTLNESKGKVPTICDTFGYCEKLDIHDVTPEQLVELIKKNNLMEIGGELEKGIKAEKEHIGTAVKLYQRQISPQQSAESIAKEHLKEDPKYYTKLIEMETKFAKGGTINIRGVDISVGDEVLLQGRSGVKEIKILNITDKWVIFTESGKRKDTPLDSFIKNYVGKSKPEKQPTKPTEQVVGKKFNAGDIVEWKEANTSYSAKKGAKATVAFSKEGIIDVKWLDTPENKILVNGQFDGGYKPSDFILSENVVNKKIETEKPTTEKVKTQKLEIKKSENELTISDEPEQRLKEWEQFNMVDTFTLNIDELASKTLADFAISLSMSSESVQDSKIIFDILNNK